MKKLIYSILLLTVFPLGKTIAQYEYSLGLGGGPNYYYDWSKENFGYTLNLDARYEYNKILSLTFAYSFNHLSAAEPSYYFKTSANNLDLHFGFDLLQISGLASNNYPLKVLFDIGAGCSFYNEGLYLENGELYTYYIDSQGWGCAAKMHMGGEIAYKLNDTYSLYFSLLGHLYFSSSVDGKEYYYRTTGNGVRKKTDCFNDMFITSTVGVRYNLENLNFNTSSKSRSSSNSSYKKAKLKRYQGKKSPRKRTISNKKKTFINPFKRYFGKKNNKKTIKKQEKVRPQRWTGKKTKKKLLPKKNKRYQGNKKNKSIYRY